MRRFRLRLTSSYHLGYHTGMTGNTGKALMTRDELSAHLQDEVVTGRLREGTKLEGERGLAKSFGVSRPVVREALRDLVERGLIEVLPGRGAYVRGARTADAARPLGMLFRRRQATPRDLVEARKMLEVEAVSLATVRATGHELEVMGRILEGFEGSTDLLEKVRFDVAFHASIARASRNPVIEVLFDSMATLVAELMLRSLGDPNVSRAGLPFHRDIYEAVKVGDRDRAREAMMGHLLVAERLYGEDYDKTLGGIAQRELQRLFEPDALVEGLLGHGP